MKLQQIFLISFSFILGITVTISFTLYGFDFIADIIAILLIVLAFFVIVLLVLICLINRNKDRILKPLFKITETQLEAIIDPMKQAVTHIIAGKTADTIANGADFLRILLAHYSWFTLQRWMITVILGLLAVFAGLATSALMFRQNSLLLDQNHKLDLQNFQFQQQNQLIKSQNDSIDLQIKIAKQQVLPQFVISAKQLQEPGEENASHDKMVVDNSGAVVSELHGTTAIFLDVELYYRQPKRGDPIKKRIAINGYYAATGHSPQGQGQMLTMIGNRNNERASVLSRDFSAYVKEYGMYGFVEVKRYLKLWYRDQLGEQHTNYYFVPLIFGAHTISKDEGKAIFLQWKDAILKMEMLEFDTLTKEQLYKAAFRD